MGKNQAQNIRAKYRNLPDMYYEGDESKIITPERFEAMGTDLVQSMAEPAGPLIVKTNSFFPLLDASSSVTIC